MFKLRFTNSLNQTVELYDYPFRLISVTGIGDTEASIQAQRAPFRDGLFYIDSILQDKPIEIELKIVGEDEEDTNAKRRWFSSLFNPKLGEGVLSYISGDDVKEIEVVPESVPFLPDGSSNRKPTFQRALLNLRALNPYWRSPEESTRPLKAFEGTFTFPFTFPVQFGIESDTNILNNEGDTTTPITVEIKGPIRRPIIENLTTGKFMQINAIVEPDQTLVIDTNPLNKRVVLRQGDEERTVMGWFDQEGDFLQLVEGDNEIRYRADAGTAEASAIVRWNNRYVGV